MVTHRNCWRKKRNYTQRNISEILLYQTEIRLYLPISSNDLEQKTVDLEQQKPLKNKQKEPHQKDDPKDKTMWENLIKCSRPLLDTFWQVGWGLISAPNPQPVKTATKIYIKRQHVQLSQRVTSLKNHGSLQKTGLLNDRGPTPDTSRSSRHFGAQAEGFRECS